MTDRKFYKTLITVEVLSEDPIPVGMTLEQIAHEAIHGDYSMNIIGNDEVELNGKQAADHLYDQGSDPVFFRIDGDGNDVE